MAADPPVPPTAGVPDAWGRAQDVRPILVAGMYRSGTTRVFHLVRDAPTRHHGELRSGAFPSPLDLEAALRPGPGVYKGHELTEGIVDRARWDEVLVVATLRDPLDAARSLCRSLGWSAHEAVDRTEEAVRWLEALGPHVTLVDWRDAVGPGPRGPRRALAGAGLPVSTVEAARLSLRWRRSQTSRRTDHDSGSCPWVADGHRGSGGAVHRTEPRETLGRLVAGVRGHHLDDRVARLRARAGARAGARR